MNEVTIFQFNANDVRVLIDEYGKPIWVAKDVCIILGYANSSKAVSDHCRSKGVTNRYPLQTTGGEQYPTCIDEGNLYRLIIKSNKPESETFEAWVCDEVLPSIRKTGTYAAPSAIHNIPEGMTLVPSEEIFTLYRDTKTLLEENNRMLRQQLEAAESKIVRRVNFTPDEDAQVIKLHKQGLSHREIGLAIGRKRGSVRSCLNRLKRAGIYTEAD